jgi:hypothetical protein
MSRFNLHLKPRIMQVTLNRCPPLKAAEFNVQNMLEDVSPLQAAEFITQNLLFCTSAVAYRNVV